MSPCFALLSLQTPHSSEPHQPQAAGTRLKHVAHPSGTTPHPNPFQVLRAVSFSVTGSGGGELLHQRGPQATPSPASPPNASASLGSPGQRAAWWPKAGNCVPQGHMESPNTITPQEAEPLKRASGWALSDPARLHPHKRGRLATHTHTHTHTHGRIPRAC